MAYAKKTVRKSNVAKQEREPSMGGMWLNKDKQGRVYFSGVLETKKGDLRIVAFKNKYATEENREPTFRIYRSRPVQKRVEETQEVVEETQEVDEETFA